MKCFEEVVEHSKDGVVKVGALSVFTWDWLYHPHRWDDLDRNKNRR